MYRRRWLHERCICCVLFANRKVSEETEHARFNIKSVKRQPLLVRKALQSLAAAAALTLTTDAFRWWYIHEGTICSGHCPAIEPPVHGRFHDTTDELCRSGTSKHGDMCSVVCDEGYQLVSETRSLYCSWTATWRGSEPRCASVWVFVVIPTSGKVNWKTSADLIFVVTFVLFSMRFGAYRTIFSLFKQVVMSTSLQI